MRIDRFEVRRVGRAAATVAIVAGIVSLVLERAHDIARDRANGAVEWHEHTEHDGDDAGEGDV